MRKGAGDLNLYWTRDATDQPDVFGAFKAGAVYAFRALCRLLWSVLHQPASPHELPRPLIAGRTPQQFRLTFDPAEHQRILGTTATLVQSFLAGESRELLQWLEMGSSLDKRLLFHQNLIRSDLETLEGFFKTGPQRLRRLKSEHGVERGIVLKEELDDLIALSEATQPKDPLV
jgi:hypothetical protein